MSANGPPRMKLESIVVHDAKRRLRLVMELLEQEWCRQQSHGASKLHSNEEFHHENCRTFTFRKPASNLLRSTRLEVIEFSRRFLQHVLPTGFVKVRLVGFLNANCTVTITTIRGLIAQPNATPAKLPQATTEPVAQWPCSHCGAPLQVVMRVWHERPAGVDTG